MHWHFIILPKASYRHSGVRGHYTYVYIHPPESWSVPERSGHTSVQRRRADSDTDRSHHSQKTLIQKSYSDTAHNPDRPACVCPTTQTNKQTTERQTDVKWQRCVSWSWREHKPLSWYYFSSKDTNIWFQSANNDLIIIIFTNWFHS